MKNKLLITTALFAVFSMNNAFAQASLPELTVSDKKELTGDQGVAYDKISVEKNGTLILNGANIKTSAKDSPTDDIVVNGILNLTNNSVLEAGSDIDSLQNNSNIVFDGATVGISDSDLEANGNITIKNTNLTATSSIPAPDNFGIWADGNITIDNSNIDIQKNSYMDAAGDITINSGTINLTNVEVNSWDGNMNINGGEINLQGDDSHETLLYARKELNINGGVINMSGDEAIIDNIADYKPDEYPTYDLNINGGEINVTGKEAEISSSKNVNLNGGTINIAQGSTLGIYGGNDKLETTAQFGSKAIMNLAGTLDTNLEGNGSLNIISSSALVTGDINGTNLSFDTDHSLSKAISGTIGDLASLNVNKGTLSFDKSTGTIANLNVSSTLDVGTNTVNATNVAFKDNSTLKFTVAGTEDGGYGKIKANNISVSNKGTLLDLTLNSSVLGDGESKDFTILDAATISGEFAQLSENSRYDFEKLGNGKYKITGKATAADIVADAGGTSNNAGTASAWDSVELEAEPTTTAGTIAVALADLSNKATTPEAKKAYVDALTAVAPEAAPMVQQTQSQTSNQVFGAVGTRLSGGSVSTGGEGMSSGDNIFERAAMWVQGLFNKSELENTSDSYGFDADSSGIAMGVEKYINDDTKLGLGYAYTNTDIDGFMRSTDVDTHTAIIYGEYKPSNWYVNGVATYGWSDYEENKNVAGIGVKSKYDAESFGLQAMTGYDMQVKGFGLTPEVGLRYVHISQDAYTDTAGQSVSGNDSDILTGVIGAKVTKEWQLSNGMMIKPEAKFALTYDLFNDDASSVVSLANGSAYTVEGEALDRFGMEFGAGVTAEVNDNIEFSLGYEGKFRQDYQDHTGLINAKYKF